MSHGVLALGGAALCLSGSVWYVPAWADLRAGPDRPASRRLAATAVLLLWAGARQHRRRLRRTGPERRRTPAQRRPRHVPRQGR
ncbi:hypothetical protein ACWEP3_31875, partial [Streptomyces albidoflavus]